MIQQPIAHAAIEKFGGGIRAHAAGVWAGVAIADALVILRGDQRRNALSITEDEK